MTARAHRLPQRITLPFGYTVQVRHVSRAQMKAMSADGPDGLWQVDERTIYLVRTLPAARRRWCLYHELQHAVIDGCHELVGRGVMRG